MGGIMTEGEWPTSSDPRAMLEFLVGMVSDRKMRLYAVACCRQLCCPLFGELNLAAIQTAENHAEGLASDSELQDAGAAALDEYRRLVEIHGFGQLGGTDNPVAYLTCGDGTTAALLVPEFAARLAAEDSYHDVGWTPGYEAERAKQSALLRDLIGNPFRPVTLQSDWLTTIVLALAQGINDERAFDRLPILADALEDAGCDNADILGHCRQPGEHARGCWVVDLLLGKQ
jgi:hypothetical protein